MKCWANFFIPLFYSFLWPHTVYRIKIFFKRWKKCVGLNFRKYSMYSLSIHRKLFKHELKIKWCHWEENYSSKWVIRIITTMTSKSQKIFKTHLLITIFPGWKYIQIFNDYVTIRLSSSFEKPSDRHAFQIPKKKGH